MLEEVDDDPTIDYCSSLQDKLFFLVIHCAVNISEIKTDVRKRCTCSTEILGGRMGSNVLSKLWLVLKLLAEPF